jgi:hypothetical protein
MFVCSQEIKDSKPIMRRWWHKDRVKGEEEEEEADQQNSESKSQARFLSFYMGLSL